MHPGIVVLGCHRSGTSALAGALAAAGAYVGRVTELVGPTAANAAGHFERADFRAFHDHVLELLGGAWWDPVRLDDAGVASRFDAALRLEHRALVEPFVRSAARDGAPWLLKDPRLSILLPLLMPQLPAALAVVVVRDPREVALSLQRRDGIGLGAGLALWELHTRGALIGARDFAAAELVRHEDLMREPAVVLQRVLGGVGGSPSDLDAIDRAARTVDPGLVTVRAGSLSIGWLTVEQRELWERVRSGDVDGLGPAGPQPWESIAEERMRRATLAVERRRLEALVEGLEGLVEDLESRMAAGVAAQLEAARRAEARLSEERRRAEVLSADLDRRLVRLALPLSRAAAPVFRRLRGSTGRRVTPRRVAVLLWSAYRAAVPLHLRLLVPRRLRRRLEAWLGGRSALPRRGGDGSTRSAPLLQPDEADLLRPTPLDLPDRWLPTGVIGPLAEAPLAVRARVPVVATYFPQFHVIPENERWWGEGYTDWDRVLAARPRFPGHRQPRRPGELGRYDPTRSETVRAQSRLAAGAGVDGFMVYGYHFEGRLLLDGPLERIADDAVCDRAYFVCWANENWTRVWDGLDDDVLLRVDNSTDGVLAALEAFAIHLDARRCLRVDDRPTFGIYAPHLIDDATWRALDVHLGSRAGTRPMLALVDRGAGPGRVALGGAAEAMVRRGDAFTIDFPPLSPSPRRLEPHEVSVDADADQMYFDYRSLVGTVPTAPRVGRHAPAVTPGWDNTARRESGASILVGDSPSDYHRWLSAALDHAGGSPQPAPFVLVNGWNEWSEAAYLEPDEDDGFARLLATRRAVVRARASTGTPSSSHVLDGLGEAAVIVHAYHHELLGEIIAAFPAPERLTWWVSTAARASAVRACADELGSRGLRFQVRPVVNRGRDLWPFILLLEEARAAGARHFIKLHTKRSPHRVDGDRWRRQLVRDVVASWYRHGHEPAAQDGPAMTIPSPHALPLGDNIGSNAPMISSLLARAGGGALSLDDHVFAAGSMFHGRVAPFIDALRLLDLAEDSFPREEGQLDGTLAHALERAWVPLLGHLRSPVLVT